MAEHCYALVTASGEIVRTTEPLERAPAPVLDRGAYLIWQQCPDDAPAHNPDLHELHSPEFRMVGHRVHRIWKIRRKK